jgi:hypothetical protein
MVCLRRQGDELNALLDLTRKTDVEASFWNLVLQLFYSLHRLA